MKENSNNNRNEEKSKREKGYNFFFKQYHQKHDRLTSPALIYLYTTIIL